MKLKSFSYFYCLLIISLYFSPLYSEDKIDIWNNKGKKQLIENKEPINKKDSQKLNSDSIKTIDIYKGVIPFIFIQLLMLILLSIFPIIATWLPSKIL